MMRHNVPCRSSIVFIPARSRRTQSGMVAVTMAVNVPLNDALAAADPATADGAAQWARDVLDWTRWNHVRTVASSASACALFVAGIAARSGRGELGPNVTAAVRHEQRAPFCNVGADCAVPMCASPRQVRSVLHRPPILRIRAASTAVCAVARRFSR
ncbi:anthrone oxygenase family protein [Burkholderia sp. Bp9140]|uniref:anthrone oxygenase family protein n=1 Tax=Burkholderia sp. Bp9140 TaxID=2184572 RepID=UPI0021AB8C55|nr:anthrone oxygenase family protein [Burkholderia sp. Bp9140]